MSSSHVPVIPLAAVAPARAVFAVQQILPSGPWTFHHHTHRGFCELVYVGEGGLDHHTASGEERLPAGTLLFIRERDRHALAGERMRYFNLNLPTAEWWRLDAFLGEAGLLERLEGADRPPRATLPPADQPRIEADFTELFLHQGDQAPARRRLTRFLLTWLPILAEGLARTGDPRPAWLKQLMAEVDDRLESGVQVTDLPRRAGVTAEHLARTFRRHLGCTPSAWLTKRRVERAALLLTHTDRPLTDIALGLGFDSLSWFHASFRAVHQETPATYRRLHGIRVAGS